jgi:hypothetical protein
VQPAASTAPPTQQFPAQPAPSAAAAAAARPQPTGPVDYVPGPPPVPPEPARAPAAASVPSEDFLRNFLDDEPRTRDPRARAGAAGAGLALAAVVLLEVGMTAHGGGSALWPRIPLWCAFATVCAVLALAALPGVRRVLPRGARASAVAAVGLAGVAVFWLLVVLPVGNTDRGFVLTAALACLAAGVWLTAGRGGASGPAHDPAPSGSATEGPAAAG